MNRLSSEAWRGDEAGAAAVEFALLLPVLAVLLFGFLEVGRLLWDYHIVTAAVRDAARYAARQDIACDPAAAFNGDLGRVQRLARTGRVDGSTPLIAGWTDDASVTVTVQCVTNSTGAWRGTYRGMSEFPVVMVTAAAPHTALMGGLLPGLNVSTIRVSDQQVWTE